MTIVCHTVNWMDSKIRAAWKGLESVTLEECQALEKGKECRSEIYYYMSSLKKPKA